MKLLRNFSISPGGTQNGIDFGNVTVSISVPKRIIAGSSTSSWTDVETSNRSMRKKENITYDTFELRNFLLYCTRMVLDAAIDGWNWNYIDTQATATTSLLASMPMKIECFTKIDLFFSVNHSSSLFIDDENPPSWSSQLYRRSSLTFNNHHFSRRIDKKFRPFSFAVVCLFNRFRCIDIEESIVLVFVFHRMSAMNNKWSVQVNIIVVERDWTDDETKDHQKQMIWFILHCVVLVYSTSIGVSIEWSTAQWLISLCLSMIGWEGVFSTYKKLRLELQEKDIDMIDH